MNEIDRHRLNEITKGLKRERLALHHKHTRVSEGSHKRLELEHQPSYTMQDDEWLLQMRIMINEYSQSTLQIDCRDSQSIFKKLDISDMLTLIEKEVSQQNEKNEERWSNLKRTVKSTIGKEEIFLSANQNLDEVLIDLKSKIQEEDNYLYFLERKQIECKEFPRSLKPPAQEKNGGFSEKRPKASGEDVVCQVCNDGDYTEEDLIVFCSVGFHFQDVLIIYSIEMQYLCPPEVLRHCRHT